MTGTNGATTNGKVGLAAYEAKRLTLTATWESRKDWIDRHTQWPRDRHCLKTPELDGKVLASHVLLLDNGAIMDMDPQPGERIKLTAIVYGYQKRDRDDCNLFTKDWGLDGAQDIEWP